MKQSPQSAARKIAKLSQVVRRLPPAHSLTVQDETLIGQQQAIRAWIGNDRHLRYDGTSQRRAD